MTLTVSQLKALEVVGVVSFSTNNKVRKKRKHKNVKNILAVSCTDITITPATLIEHVELFKECVMKYVERSSYIVRHYDPVLIGRLSVLRELWSLVEIPLPFPLLTSFYESKFDDQNSTYRNETLKKLGEFDTLTAEIANRGTLAIKNDGKLKRLIERRRIWMKKVKEWRSLHASHPDYNMDHPEEQKFRRKKKELQARVRQLMRNRYKL